MVVEKLSYAAHVPPGEGPFPALIALHGWGANAHDLFGLAPMIHDGKAVVLCPQGPVRMGIGGGMAGYGWFPFTPGQPPDVEAFKAAADALRGFIDAALERFPIDPARVALAGFSQGGIMAYELALREPGRFSGLAALSAWFPEPLANLLPKVPEHEGFPVLVVHGTRDPSIPVERAREAREALRSYGVALMYREFDMGHEIHKDALRVILRWLDERAFVREAAAASP
ncbi:MAG TPA: dienelactone hydrolase family protein [Thermoanaerobaculia bacterium]|nr:dienelactone hydrolase family protein [Thermoanaerobaculia bacterium]